MAQKISRRSIAAYVADGVIRGEEVSKRVDEVAAYLISTKRTREARLVVHAIEDELEARGVIVATVTSARQLDKAVERSIADMLGGGTLMLRHVVDPQVIGGIRVDTPSSRLDATVKHNLTVLRERAKQ